MDSISRANGGIYEAEKSLQKTLHQECGVDVEVFGLRDISTEMDSPTWRPLVPQSFEVTGPTSFGYAPGLLDGLLRAQADLGYFVGLWKYPSLAARQWSKQTGKPMIVAPHGMLDPWALRNSGMKKRIAGWLYQNTQLRQAACLRAVSQSEADSMRAYGLTNPIAIIPNGIELPARNSASHQAFTATFAPGRKVMLYLGRIHPKKGLRNLIGAWSRIHPDLGKEWLLVIAGWDQGGHEDELKKQATELKLTWSDDADSYSGNEKILFPGARFGEAKAAIYSRCDAFVLPSFSEGLPMAVLEAWAYGKPVIMTDACNLPEGFARSAALRIDSTIGSVEAGIRQLGEMSDVDRQTMGENGRELVTDCFAWSKIGTDMKKVYEWILNAGPMPECVSVK